MVRTLIDTDTRHHSGQNVVDSRAEAERAHNNILATAMTRIIVNKNTDHTKPHFDFFFCNKINVKENFFARA